MHLKLSKAALNKSSFVYLISWRKNLLAWYDAVAL